MTAADRPPAGRRGRPRRVATWRAGADPGLLRLRVALRGVLGVGATAVMLGLLAPWVQLPALAAMLLGGMLGLHGAVTAAGRPPRDVLRTLAPFPLPVAIGATAAAGLAPIHPVQLAAFAVLLVAAVWIRRYGLRALAYGLLGYLSFFTTAMLGLPLARVPDLLVIAVVGTAITIVVSAVLLPDRPRSLYLGAVEGFVRRIRRVAALAAVRVDRVERPRSDERPGRRRTGLTRRPDVDDALIAAGFRVMESALLVDGYLTPKAGAPDAAEPADLLVARSAQARRRQLMDAEVAADDLIDAARAMTTADPAVAGVLRQLSTGDAEGARAAAIALTVASGGPRRPDGAQAAGGAASGADGDRSGDGVRRPDSDHRSDILRAVVRLVDAVPAGLGPEHEPVASPERPPVPDRITGYRSAVDLVSGAMPGAKGSAAAAAVGLGRGWSLDNRQVVQAAVAAPVVLLLAELLSPVRFGWGMLACLLVLTGTFTAAEVVTKGVHRLVGTIGGMVAATLAVAVTGTTPAAVISVMLVCVFFGLYFFRVSYAALAFAITTLMGELYNLEGQFSSSLLLLRVVETAVGAGVAVAVTFLVVPLRARHAWSAARDAYEQQMASLTTALAVRLRDPDPVGDLLLAQRRVDARTHQLVVVGQPFSGNNLAGGLTVFRPRSGLIAALTAAGRARRLTLLVVRTAPGSRSDLADRLAALAEPSTARVDVLPAGTTGGPDRLSGAVDDFGAAWLAVAAAGQADDDASGPPGLERRTAPSARSRT